MCRGVANTYVFNYFHKANYCIKRRVSPKGYDQMLGEVPEVLFAKVRYVERMGEAPRI